MTGLEWMIAKRLIDGHHTGLDYVEPCKCIWLSEVLALERGGREAPVTDRASKAARQ